MDISKLTYILIQGFVIGAGPCLLICAPILLPYIAGTQRSWQQGLKTVLIFGLTRLVVYTLLGGVVGYVGYYLFQLFYNQLWGKYLWSFAGFLIVILGVLIIMGKGIQNPWCRFLQKQGLESSTKSMIMLGVLLGLSPCLPMLAVLTEIMFIAEEFYQGFLYGFAFGLGTVVSPLLLLGAATPVISARLIKTERAMRVFNFICGFLLIGIGAFIIYHRATA